MSKEGAEGATGGEEQVKDLGTEHQQYKKKLEDAVKEVKELEAQLKQYEEDAAKHIKDMETEDKSIKEEIRLKLQESAKEKDRLIKTLIQKLQATEEELKEAKITHEDRMSKAINDNVSKDSQIAQLVKKVKIYKKSLLRKKQRWK
ncbi:PREDICTED: myosin-11-like [Amphimedon queenslandica]|uniref:Uncharacterized protein n=1 Tax=Amphimedon queenslandica TaxID=400682 RepID=A0AAN0JRS4_AMPQE|nr:PREDICTED: myosin-11-like [Amphimedon queenslandica]|eukprot:XP_019859561.1 PREDICTED: myosin-11-like [Amphimedon queenslandica]